VGSSSGNVVPACDVVVVIAAAAAAAAAVAAAAAAAFAFLLRIYIQMAMITATNRTAFTMIPINPPRGKPPPLWLAFGGARINLSENTRSVMRVMPETVGVDAGISVLLSLE
jgi:hypothetical protein